MDPSRLAVIKKSLGVQEVFGRHVVDELIVIAEAAQAELAGLCDEYVGMEAERDVVQAENQRLTAENTRERMRVEKQISRLARQVTAAVELLRTWIADYDNEAWPYPADETRVFLAAFTTTEETP